MCGKDQVIPKGKASTLGSPPHVRERHTGVFLDEFRSGITPACAGKTTSSTNGTTIGEDHPRMCGKDLPTVTHDKVLAGSPPHVRERPCMWR